MTKGKMELILQLQEAHALAGKLYIVGEQAELLTQIRNTIARVNNTLANENIDFPAAEVPPSPPLDQQSLNGATQ